MTLSVYSFEDVAATANNLKVTGFWEGDDAIVIEPFTARATPMVGVDGESIVSHHAAGKSATIRIRLKPDSPANQLFQTYLEQRRIFPLVVRNTGRGEGGAAAEATVVEEPGINFGGNATVREWVIFAGRFDRSLISYQAP